MPLLRKSLCILAIASPALSDINATTSYQKMNEYKCTMATTDGVKPFPLGIDHFRMQSLAWGIADLYGDGTLETIFPASDATFSTERVAEGNHPTFMYEGNEERSRGPYQHAFYSPDETFTHPKGTRYPVTASIITQDFNGDGVDDIVVASFGTDYEPFEPARAEILISSEKGYMPGYLPGGKQFYHTAAAGDIDGDGDVDIVMDGAVSGFRYSQVNIYKNNGDGQFTHIKTRFGFKGLQIFGLFDIDDDGQLDIVARVPTNFEQRLFGLRVLFGLGNGTFTPGKDTFYEDYWESKVGYKRGSKDTSTRYKHFVWRVPSVGDIDGDGKAEVVLAGTVDDQEHLYAIHFDKRRIARTELLWKQKEKLSYPLQIYKMALCDLGSGSLDIVSEVFGQHHYSNGLYGKENDLATTDKLIFKNDGDGKFEFYKLDNPELINPRFKNLVYEFAKHLGVSVKAYTPRQVYYPNNLDDRDRFLHPYYNQREQYDNFPYNTVPEVSAKLGYTRLLNLSTSQENSPYAVSERVKAILKNRRGGETDDAIVNEQKGTSTIPASTYQSSSKPNNPNAVSARVKAILEARKKSAGSD